MRAVFDFLQIFFWALLYLMIVITWFRHRKEAPLFIPVVSVCLNFSWEIIAVYHTHAYWGVVAWVLLDTLIFLQSLKNMRSRGKNPVLYFAALVLFIVCFFFVSQHEPAWTLTVFAIDLWMAAEFIYVAGKISPRHRTLFGTVRLCGDLFAWLAYLHVHIGVAVMGFLVLLLNLFYLAYTLELGKKRK